MKKIIIASFLLLTIFQTAWAASPCTTAFALGFAQARAQYYTDREYCEQFSSLRDWCFHEVQMGYAYNYSNLVNNFNTCCCANGYPECCN